MLSPIYYNPICQWGRVHFLLIPWRKVAYFFPKISDECCLIVSNFSKPGYECSHNLHYWNIEPYLAFGPSAHGFDGQYRWNNSRSLDRYTSCILAGKSAISTREKISTMEHINEKVGFGLRMKKGFEIKGIPKQYQKLLRNNIKSAQEKYPDCINTKSNSKSLLFLSIWCWNYFCLLLVKNNTNKFLYCY